MSAQLKIQTKPVSSFTSIQPAVLQRQCACGQHTIAGGVCEECRQKREGTIQRTAVNSTPTNTIAQDVPSSPNQSPDADTRAFKEPGFEYNFSQIKVYTDPQAGKQSKAPTARKAVDPRKIEVSAGSRREHLDPNKIQQVLQEIWWLNGAQPRFSFFPDQVPLGTGLPNSGQFHYTITKGADKLVLLDGTRETTSLDVMNNPEPVVKSKGESTTKDDIELSVTYTPPGSNSSKTLNADLEVHAPHQIDLLYCNHKAKGRYGYDTQFQMQVLDNFGEPIPYIDVNEDFTPGTLAQGATNEWLKAIHARKKGSAITLGDGYFEDHYYANISGGRPPKGMSPVPRNPQSPLGNILVATFTHDWYVGSPVTGKGVHVSTHLGQLYADHGQYSDFTSPISPSSKSTSCPPEGAPVGPGDFPTPSSSEKFA